MKPLPTILLAAAALGGAVAVAMAAPPAKYAMVGFIPGPDGTWDYASLDPTTRKLYVSREYGVMAVDVDSRAVTPHFTRGQRVHSSLPLPGGATLVQTNGDSNTVDLVDTATGRVQVSIPAGKNPDGAAYDPATKLVFVMNAKSGDATLIDPVAGTAVGTIPIGGELEFPASDGHGRLYVNVADKAEIAVIDTRARTVVARYPMSDCQDPSGLAFVAKSQLLISVCDNGKAKVLKPDGKLVATLDIGKGPDAVIVDIARDRAFVPAGFGDDLSVIDLHDPANPKLIQRLPTKHGAHTGAIDPKTGYLYLPTCDYGPPVEGKRPKLPGTFGIIVVAPDSGA
jgi:YVTN family beta-propeller protein